MRNFARLYGPLLGAVLLSVIIAVFFVDPAPPKSVVIAGGNPGGAYVLTGQTYAAALAHHDVEAAVLDTAGSVANLELLKAGKADIAIVQTGVVEDTEGLVSLGAVFYEPFWVFHRADLKIDDLRNLAGLRVAVGGEGAGVRVLAESLLTEVGVKPDDYKPLPLSGAEAADALRAGQADAVLFVTGASAPWIGQLAADPSVVLMPVRRAPAISRRHPYLGRVTLFEGVLDPADDVPQTNIPLIAPTAQIVVREALHPAIQALLIEAAYDAHGGGTIFAEPGEFPNKEMVDVPLSTEAKRYYKRGPSFLRRIFSFSLANFLERAWVLLIPLVTLLIPVVRAAPPIYRWSIRRKIYIWYRDLRGLEAEGRAAATPSERREVLERLMALQAEAGKVEVPLSYTDDLYHLRSHIAFVTDLIDRLDKTSAPSDGEAGPPAELR